MSRRFSKILVANRGEIACRIFRTAHDLNYATVAVFSDADANALHVSMADEAVRIGAASPADSYLNGGAILDAAKRTGADAVHPGYGFLSENAEFARACSDAGITFIGPPPEAIDAMGDKANAKRMMRQADVPCVPGYEGEDQSESTFAREAKAIGYPVLLKAAAGGGGRGMRRVSDASELSEAIVGARSEARNAFGSDTLILEKLVENARHIEFQILADEHGHCMHLGERDCSVQRRHQKIIEESPSPAMTDALRAAMGAAAVTAARAAGYTNAGTVEFLLGEDGVFYFLEMNTRLQVEHPVTEMVTDRDLVADQLAIAQGSPLETDGFPDSPRGHAIEARVYAEDPDEDFRPQTGAIARWSPPGNGAASGLRVDHGLRERDAVTPYYDPMLAKIIVFGDSRGEALDRLRTALGETVLLGLRTNIPLLQRILDDETFLNGGATIHYLENSPLLNTGPRLPGPLRRLVAAAAFIERDTANVPRPLKGWRSTRVCNVPLRLECDGDDVLALDVSMDGSTYAATFDDARLEIVIESFDTSTLTWTHNGHRQTAEIAFDADTLYLHFDGYADRFEDVTYAPATSKDGASDGIVKSPMAGSIVRVNVAAGDRVSKGDVLLIVEAMKMENQVIAPLTGTISEISADVNQQVSANQILVTIETDGEEQHE